MNERIDGGRGDISVAVGAVMRICPVRCFGILLFYLFFFWFISHLTAIQYASFFSDNGSLEDRRKKAEG